MPDLSDRILPHLRSHRLEGIDLGSDALHPYYGGYSLLNLTTSLCRWLEGPDLPHPPLGIEEIGALADDVLQVIFVLVDAVSLERFREWLRQEACGLEPLLGRGHLAPLTSVVPATTSTALTTLWTGRSPAEHGILGYELFLREYGLIANMITYSPMAFEGMTGALRFAGLGPKAASPVATIAPDLARAGIETHVYLHTSIRDSGLSRVLYAPAEMHGYDAPEQLWESVGALAGQRIDHRRLIWVYYGHVDTLSHRLGPRSDHAGSDFARLTRTMVKSLVDGFTSPVADRTLLIMTSDHGQIDTPEDPRFHLRLHPAVVRRLHMNPTGENRFSYLYLRPGKVSGLVSYFEKTWPNDFRLVVPAKALKAGLFGPGEPAEVARDRLGDLMAIAQGHSYLWWASKDNPFLGRHGGLSEQEMVVPLLAARLG